jgi:hypothetical protein
MSEIKFEIIKKMGVEPPCPPDIPPFSSTKMGGPV